MVVLLCCRGGRPETNVAVLWARRGTPVAGGFGVRRLGRLPWEEAKRCVGMMGLDARRYDVDAGRWSGGSALDLDGAGWGFVVRVEGVFPDAAGPRVSR